MPHDKTKLMPKEEVFVREYLVDLNVAAASRRTGYKVERYAWTLMKRPRVQAAIAAGMKARLDATRISAEQVVLELARIAFSDVGEAFGEDGNLLALRKMPEAFRRSVSSVETDEIFEGSGEERRSVGLTRKVKLWDKVAALDKLGRHLGVFKSAEGEVAESFAALVMAAARKAKK